MAGESNEPNAFGDEVEQPKAPGCGCPSPYTGFVRVSNIACQLFWLCFFSTQSTRRDEHQRNRGSGVGVGSGVLAPARVKRRELSKSRRVDTALVGIVPRVELRTTRGRSLANFSSLVDSTEVVTRARLLPVWDSTCFFGGIGTCEVRQSCVGLLEAAVKTRVNARLHLREATSPALPDARLRRRENRASRAWTGAS